MMNNLNQTYEVGETHVIHDRKEFLSFLEQVYPRLVSEVVVACSDRQ
jgi:hypothetical protein